MKKRLLSMLLALTMVLSMLPATAISALAWEAGDMAGSGTIDDPYQVDSPEDLERLDGATTGTWFKLTQDIDMSGRDYTGRYVISTFGGILNGDGHAIKNLKLRTEQLEATRSNKSALFQTISAGACVMNLTVDSPEWGAERTSYGSGYAETGIFCKDNKGTIDNCKLINGAILTGAPLYADDCDLALFCYTNSSSGVIRNCTVSGSMKIVATYYNGIGNRWFGELVMQNNGTMANCTIDVSVTRSSGTAYDYVMYCGPLATFNAGVMYNCWSTNANAINIDAKY